MCEPYLPLGCLRNHSLRCNNMFFKDHEQLYVGVLFVFGKGDNTKIYDLYIYPMLVKLMTNCNVKLCLFFDIGKEEEARVHQHMHVVAQRQVGNYILFL